MKTLKNILFWFVAVTASSAVAALVVKNRTPEFGDENDDVFSVVAAMGGRVFESKTQSLTEARATAFMGGIELDLLDAELAPGAFLTLRAVMGGIDVIVPAHWRVEVMARSLMGGVGNLSDPDADADQTPVLLVDALAVVGGIEIHAAEVG
ncbi:MAG: LiaF domain-containing protein [Actinomycetota bacterium]